MRTNCTRYREHIYKHPEQDNYTVVMSIVNSFGESLNFVKKRPKVCYYALMLTICLEEPGFLSNIIFRLV